MTPGIERCDPADLGPSRAHVRGEHSDPGDQLVESVANVGIITPPIARIEDSEVRLIDGVRRAKAAAEAGIEEIPVVVRDLDDIDAKCQSLTLNDAEAGVAKEVIEEDREKSLGRLEQRTGSDREEIEADIGMLSNAERIARELSDVPGVGRKTAERIAEHYDYEDLVEAPDGYESGCWAPDTPLSVIDGVGEQTAGAIRRHLWGEIHA
jgi:ParB-like chromosome segregation protein Spo0J